MPQQADGAKLIMFPKQATYEMFTGAELFQDFRMIDDPGGVKNACIVFRTSVAAIALIILDNIIFIDEELEMHRPADNKAPADGGPPDQVEFAEDRGFLLSGAPLFLDPKMEQAASGGLTEKNVPDVAATLATPEKARILLQVLVISKQRKPWPIPTRCQRYQLRTNHLRQAGELCSAQQYVVGGHMRCQGLIATEGPVATESSRQILMRTFPKMKDQMRFTYL